MTSEGQAALSVITEMGAVVHPQHEEKYYSPLTGYVWLSIEAWKETARTALAHRPLQQGSPQKRSHVSYQPKCISLKGADVRCLSQ